MSDDGLPTNRGRWGADDELGTLHLIDDAARARAAAEVRDASSVSLARITRPAPLTTGASPVGSPGTVPSPVMRVVNFTGAAPVALTDSLLINTHNAALTHLDALVHIPVGGSVYPGVPVAEAIAPTGVLHGSADGAAAGVVTRGVLLDLAPDGGRLPAEHRVSAGDLDAALAHARTELHPGDAVVVRGGWDTDLPMSEPVPGLDLDAVGWLHDRDVALYIGDIGDPRPLRPPMPVHQVGLARLGLLLVDAADLGLLAAHCTERERWSFMLVLAPPRIAGTTGLPVNPLAIF